MFGQLVAKITFPPLFRLDLFSGPLVRTFLVFKATFCQRALENHLCHRPQVRCSMPVECLDSRSCWLDADLVHEMAPDDIAPKHAEFLEHLRYEEQSRNIEDTAGPSHLSAQTWKMARFGFRWLRWIQLPAINFIRQHLTRYSAVPVSELRKADYTSLPFHGDSTYRTSSENYKLETSFKRKSHKSSRLNITHIGRYGQEFPSAARRAAESVTHYPS